MIDTFCSKLVRLSKFHLYLPSQLSHLLTADSVDNDIADVQLTGRRRSFTLSDFLPPSLFDQPHHAHALFTVLPRPSYFVST